MPSAVKNSANMTKHLTQAELEARRQAEEEVLPQRQKAKLKKPGFISGSRQANAVMVFRLWQEWQRLCRFDQSVNSSQSPLWSRMWSTSVAGVRMPRAAHARQKGSRRSCPGRRSSVQICP